MDEHKRGRDLELGMDVRSRGAISSTAWRSVSGWGDKRVPLRPPLAADAFAGPGASAGRGRLLSAGADRSARKSSRFVRGRACGARRHVLEKRGTPASDRRALRSRRGGWRHERLLAAASSTERAIRRRPHPDPRQPRRLRRAREAQRIPVDGPTPAHERRHVVDRVAVQLQSVAAGLDGGRSASIRRCCRRSVRRSDPIAGYESAVFFDKETFGVGPPGDRVRRGPGPRSTAATGAGQTQGRPT